MASYICNITQVLEYVDTSYLHRADMTLQRLSRLKSFRIFCKKPHKTQWSTQALVVHTLYHVKEQVK